MDMNEKNGEKSLGVILFDLARFNYDLISTIIDHLEMEEADPSCDQLCELNVLYIRT